MNNIKKTHLKVFLGNVPFVRKLHEKLLKMRLIKNKKDLEALEVAEKLIIPWKDSMPKPRVALVKEYTDETRPLLYWTKFRRFLENNDIPYFYLDIHSSTFIQDVKQADIIIWRTLNTPSEQYEAKTKIRILEKELGKLCFPSLDELWFYEDKIRQHYLFEVHGIPHVDTFISFSKNETMSHIKHCTYPIVSKIANGSGSLGVKLIQNHRQAKQVCERIFGNGLQTYWPYLKQKDYVYFQEFIKNAPHDLRVTIVGEKYFGYYRVPQKGDFRASGSGVLVREGLPTEALWLAKTTKEKLPKTRLLAVDFILDPRDQQYRVIECSIFIQVITTRQLVVDGVVGYYTLENDQFEFHPGKYWLQEFMLMEVMNDWKSSVRSL